MTKKMTVKEAAEKWVECFNGIPQALLEKIARANIDEVYEITPLSLGDRVYIYAEEYNGEHGKIVKRCYDGDEERYLVQVGGCNNDVVIDVEDIEVKRDGFFPMWGTMWTFDNSLDESWAGSEEGLRAMADCGFRVYEQEDLGIVFGIDGAGYDFYEAHWIPLYNARGLRWHSVN